MKELLLCPDCGTPIQCRVKLAGVERTVPCLCNCQQRKRQNERDQLREYQKQLDVRRLKTEGLQDRLLRECSFEKARPTPYLERAQRYVRNWKEVQKKNHGLLFWGAVGTGKSYLAACIANALMEQSVPVIMTSFVEILKDIQGRGSKEAEYMDALNAATLLIIDDLGAERDSAYAVEKVYSVIDRRVRSGKPMILTTNLKVQDMVGCADLSLRRIYDRIFEKCYPVEMLGTSFRLEEAARRQAQMKMLFA